MQSAAIASAGAFRPATALGQGHHHPIGYIRTNWSRDPYSNGSYSFIAKGARRKHHRILQRPIGGRIFFAGEATHPDYNSTVHAAYESGLMAAEAVLDTAAQRVGVIGAGVSGLAAAEVLAQSGVQTVVLEARNRIGGRIWTDERLGFPVDLGASWIHTIDDNPVFELSESMGIATRVTGDDYVIRGADGREMPDAEAPDWLDEVVSVQHTVGAGSDDVNARAYWIDRDYGGEDVVFPGGYSQLFEALSGGFKLRLGADVRAISLEDAGVQIGLEKGMPERFDAVIVTVPLGVLKTGHIAFDPALPSDKLEAIKRLGMGLLDKVYFRFRDVFWDRDTTWIITPDTGLPPGQFNQWLNLFPYMNAPIILGFNGGQPARDLAGLSDDEIVSRALGVLRSAYPA